MPSRSPRPRAAEAPVGESFLWLPQPSRCGRLRSGQKGPSLRDIHVDSALKCRSNVNKTLNSGTARNSASEITGTISESNKAIV